MMYRSVAIIVLAGCLSVASGSHDIANAQSGANELDANSETSCARPGTNKVASYDLSEGTALPKAINSRLTKEKGNPLSGRGVMISPETGNCTSCHAVQDIRKKARQADSTSVTKFGLQGTVGPALDGIANKFTEGELRLLVVNPQLAFPNADSAMPAYHYIKSRKRVRKECAGRVILTAQEVEDVVAYLLTLKDEKQ